LRDLSRSPFRNCNTWPEVIKTKRNSLPIILLFTVYRLPPQPLTASTLCQVLLGWRNLSPGAVYHRRDLINRHISTKKTSACPDDITNLILNNYQRWLWPFLLPGWVDEGLRLFWLTIKNGGSWCYCRHLTWHQSLAIITVSFSSAAGKVADCNHTKNVWSFGHPCNFTGVSVWISKGTFNGPINQSPERVGHGRCLSRY
jgi:hypothetical protein